MAKANRLFKNAGAMLCIQIASYILPFLVIPYLTRVLGVDTFGAFAFGLALVQLACILTDFGFGLSATYAISRDQDDSNKVNKIVSAVLLCKLILLVLVVFVLALFIQFRDVYPGQDLFFWCLSLPILGQSLQFFWYFQGIEKMGYITIYTIFSRVTYLALVFLLINSAEQLALVAILFGSAQLLGALCGFALMLRQGVRLVNPGMRFTVQMARESADYFWSRAAVATYTAGGAFFLGIFSTSSQVAFYAAAEQLYRGGQQLFQPMSQALFPYMTRTKDISLFKKILWLMITLGVLGVVIGYYISEMVVTLIFGADFLGSVDVLNMFMLIFLLTVPSVLMGYPLLGAFGDTRSANRSVVYAGLIQIVLLGALVIFERYQAMDVVLCILLTEIFVLLYRWRKARILLKTGRLELDETSSIAN